MSDRHSNAIEPEAAVRELSVPADEGQLSRVRDFISSVCEDCEFSARETSNTKLAVDEACTNIIKHAYKGTPGEIRIRALISPGKLQIRLFDSGIHFDFASIKDPDLDQYVETGRKGGLGVFLINRLMDGVEYRTAEGGNELILTKSSHAAVSRTLPGMIGWKGSLRYKFTLRATTGLFIIIAAIWGYIFSRQTDALESQRASQWIEKKRLAENVAGKSKDLLLRPESYSIEQTTLTAFLARTTNANADVAYVRVVDRKGEILSSSRIDEMFTIYAEPDGNVMLEEEGGVRWKEVTTPEGALRDIRVPVSVRNEGSGELVSVGSVHLGVLQGAMERVPDPRLMTTLIIIGCFIAGCFLIVGLVSVFVKPIQVLTDGVRAIGQGSLDGKIKVEGPAEIGAIASVFNEITEKFKKAQESVLEQEKLQKEIEVAKQIQHSLLPKRHPSVSGYDIAPYYQAAKEVGGDYYDFVQVDDDTLGVVVADVSGKGVPGSLVMTMIRTALRMEARGNKNASDVMTKMNDFVTDDMKKGMFVTMFYVILDSKNRTISYASAGHNPMILFRGETNETFFLNPKGFPVGISLPDESLFRRSISLEKIKLKKDDMLLIYTDGVTEAMNERREQFGEDRLIAAVKTHGHLHPKEFIKKLEAEVKAFTGGSAQNDDITVVAVKEKLAADDVLFGIRRRLIDMVDVQGMSVKEACEKMKVSPTTYYRYKKRLAALGERGLRNKILRQDDALKRVSIEQRKEMLAIIAAHPDYGAKRIAEEFNKGKEEARHLTERMVYDELKRLNMNTKDLRVEYLRRNRLLESEEAPTEESRTSREIVEDLLSSISKTESIDEMDEIDAVVGGTVRDVVEDEEETEDDESTMEDEEVVRDLVLRVKEPEEGIAVIELDGHLDSVSTNVLERKLQKLFESSRNRIVVDLSGVIYISSGGWGAIVGEVRRLRQGGGDVVLAGMLPEVYDVYEMLGFSEILRAFGSVEEARAFLNLPPDERVRVGDQPAGGSRDTFEARSASLVENIRQDAYGGDWESLRIEAATVGDRGDMAVLSLRGIIDTVSAEHLRAGIDKVITSGIYRIVTDMSQVEYVSSGGWGAFTERLRELRRRNGDIKLFGMDPDVYYVFTMLGFNIVLASFDILGEAIEDFERNVAGRRTGELPEPLMPDPVDDYDSDEEEVDLDNDVFESHHPKRESVAEDRVGWREEQEGMVAAIHGTIEAQSVETIKAAIEPRLLEEPSCLIFDLTDVDYISSIGWGLFARFHERAVLWGGSIVICGMRKELYDIFRLLEFQSFIDVYENVDAALSVLRGEQGKRRGGTRDSGRPRGELKDILRSEGPELGPDLYDSVDETGGHGGPPRPDAEDDDDADGEVLERHDGNFVDLEADSESVDVEDESAEQNDVQDKRLRRLGWGRYGDRLKRRNRE